MKTISIIYGIRYKCTPEHLNHRDWRKQWQSHSHRISCVMLFSPSAFYWSAWQLCHWRTWCGGPPGTPCSSCPREWPYRSDSSLSYRLDMRRSWLGPHRYTSPGSLWSCSGSCFVPGSLLSPDCAGDVSHKRWPPPAVKIKLKIDGVRIWNWGGVGTSIFWHSFFQNKHWNLLYS